MALNFPSSPSNGQVYIDDNGISWEYDGVKWDVTRGTINRAFSGAKVTLSSNVALTATNTAISFTTEDFDTDSYFTLSSPTKISINKSAFYRINFSVYTGSVGSSYTILIKKNGSTTLSTAVIATNQFANYDEILEINNGDYIEIYASESSSVGELTTDTKLEITRLGLYIGTNITASESFSGARTIFNSTYSTTSTSTAVSWDDTLFDQNASPIGDTYWNVSAPTKLTVGLTGYYRLKGTIATGGLDSYTAILKKNGSTTLTSINLIANSLGLIDETYYFAQNDYIELFIQDGSSTGTLTTSSYLEISRVGV